MTRDIAFLRPTETIAFDHDCLAAVCDRYGHRAEAYIAFVLSEVEALVRTVSRQRNHPSGLRRSCTDMARLCDTIGMVTLADAGRAVLDCLDGDNPTALSACTARLLRLGQSESMGGWTLAQTPGQGAVPETGA